MSHKKSLLNPQLDVFIAVAKYKSMHGAAKAIHLSQTAVTQRIRILERRLNATLFIRSRQGVALTPDGEVLLRYCNATQILAGETLANISCAGIDSTVRILISGPSSIMASRVIPNCLSVMEKFPKLMITFDINDSAERIRGLQTGATQFTVIEAKHALKEMQKKVLKPEKYLLVCSPQFQKRSLANIIASERIIDFDDADQMTLNYLKHFNLLKAAQLERHFVNRTDSLALMLKEGYGYGVLTKEFSAPYIEKNELMVLNQGKAYEHELILAWYARPEAPKYFSEIIRVIS